MRRWSPAERLLPVMYLAGAVLLVAFVLPTALRPVTPPPPTSAQLDPNAPPEDSEVVLSQLTQGTSGTAGAGTIVAVEGEAAAVPAPPAVVEKPRKGLCFGDPPRQTFSLYAAPCAAAWSGDNGGATSLGVSRDEIHLVIWHDAFASSYEGPVRDEPFEDETVRDRTYRFFQWYINERYETYGRRIRIWLGTNTSGNPTNVRAAAVKAYEEWKPFAAVIEWENQQPACDELMRRDVMCWNAPFPRSFYLDRPGYYWSWYSDTTQLREFAAEYMCKKLAGKPAQHAGDPLMQGRERRFGLKYKSNFGVTMEEFERQLKAQCGLELTEKLGLDPSGTDNAEIANGITRLKAAGVSTLVLDGDLDHTIIMSHQADVQGYFPEWLIIGTEAIDHSYTARLTSQNQFSHAFGFSGLEMPRPNEETDCFMAYKELDPGNNPDTDLCRWIFPSLIQLVNGIQMAGPNLTPETFEQGMFEMGRRFYPDVWAIGGGFAPGDYGYMDNVTELWWDPTATDPHDNTGTLGSTQGAFRYQNGGRRYRLGEFTSELKAFEEGETRAPAESR